MEKIISEEQFSKKVIRDTLVVPSQFRSIRRFQRARDGFLSGSKTIPGMWFQMPKDVVYEYGSYHTYIDT